MFKILLYKVCPRGGGHVITDRNPVRQLGLLAYFPGLCLVAMAVSGLYKNMGWVYFVVFFSAGILWILGMKKLQTIGGSDENRT